MNTKQAHKQAAKDSKDGAARYVVYVFDEGANVYDAEQARIYAPLIAIEAVYLNGVQIASQEVMA